MKKNESFVTRRVAGKRTVKVYELKDGVLTLLDEIELVGRVNEKNLAKEYKVDKVVTEVSESETEYWQVPVDEFMKIATKKETETETK